MVHVNELQKHDEKVHVNKNHKVKAERHNYAEVESLYYCSRKALIR